MAAPYNPPLRGEDFVLRVSLQDMALPGSFKLNPTIAAGDFKVDKDGTALVNISVTPVVQPAGSVLVKVALTANEMDADVVTIVGIDQTTPKEWADFVLSIPTAAIDTPDVPLVLEHDGATSKSLIMNVMSDGTFGGAITTKGDYTPSNVIWGSEYDGGRNVQIGGGFSGNRDTNGIWFWADGNEDITAPPDGGSPLLIMEGPAVQFGAGKADFCANVSVIPNIGGKYWGSLGWDSDVTPTLFNFEVGWTGSGSQKDLVFCANAAAEKWRMAYSAGSHFLPGASELFDIGSTTKRVRNTHTSTLTLTQKSALETDAGKIRAQNVGGPPLTVLEAGEIDFGLPPGYRYRVVSIGGGMATGGSDSTDPNEIAFYTDPDFTDTAPVGGGQITLTMSPERVGAFAPVTIYCDNATAKDRAILGFSADKTTFNFEVGHSTSAQSLGQQRDLVFCANTAAKKWRIAYTAGSHFLPETDVTLDIGSATKQVRSVFTKDVTMTGKVSASYQWGYTVLDGSGLTVYNSFDLVNYEYLQIGSTGSAYYITPFAAGTGVSRNILIGGGSWRFEGAAPGHLTPGVTNASDLGTAARYVRNIFTAAMNWITRTAPGAPVDGDMWFTGTALQMRVGGVTKTIQMA